MDPLLSAIVLSALCFSIAMVTMVHMLTTREIRISKSEKITHVAEPSETLAAMDTKEINEELKSAYELTREMQRLFLDDDQIDREDNNGN